LYLYDEVQETATGDYVGLRLRFIRRTPDNVYTEVMLKPVY
jgi:hypothetical protein